MVVLQEWMQETFLLSRWHRKILTGMKTFCHSSWLDQIPFTNIAGNVRIKIFHQVFPLGSHSQWAGLVVVQAKRGSKRMKSLIPGAGAAVPNLIFWDMRTNIQIYHETAVHHSFWGFCFPIAVSKIILKRWENMCQIPHTVLIPLYYQQMSQSKLGTHS